MKGMEVVDKIAAVKTGSKGHHDDVPLEPRGSRVGKGRRRLTNLRAPGWRRLKKIAAWTVGGFCCHRPGQFR
jgi:hypothetical protein